MPNGRTHIFEVETAKLMESLGLVETKSPIGTLFDSGSGTVVRVSVADLRNKVLQRCRFVGDHAAQGVWR